MKSLMILVLTLIATGMAHANDQDAKVRLQVEAFVAEHGSMLKIPKKDRKNFYTLCDTSEFTLAIGYEGGKCAAVSVDENALLEYIPISIHEFRAGIGAQLSRHLGSLHRILGASSLDDVTGLYLVATSGATGDMVNIRENYFTIKFSFKKPIGNSPDGDESTGVGYFGIDIISLGLIWYSKEVDSKSQFLQLSLNH